VRDAQDGYAFGLVVDPVEDAVRSAASAEGAGEFAFEGLADATRSGREVSERELDDRGNDAGRDLA